MRIILRDVARYLVERLGIYPAYAHQNKVWLDKKLRKPVLDLIDADGLARMDNWNPGDISQDLPELPKSPAIIPDMGLSDILLNADKGKNLSEADVCRLLAARDCEVHEVMQAADEVRKRVSGETVSYVVTRNINYTNICYFKCKFCAFSKGKMSDNLRGRPYNLGADVVVAACARSMGSGRG